MFEVSRKSKHILGINARNLLYLYPYNPRRAVLVADNKLLAKKILKKAGLPVLETYGIIKTHHDLKTFDWTSLPASFTVKPNTGLAGGGILIVYGRKKNNPQAWVKADKKQVTIENLENHILNILDGNFSLMGIPDIAFFEERAKLLKLFKPYCWRGIPDIRIIVFNMVPVMAELRVPTKASGGQANLHAGGIGVGIDLGSGITTNAIWHDQLIDYIPDSRVILRGLKIPYWQDILEMAINAQVATGLGFMGIDVTIDREKGPIIFEVNARPGLSIQIANLAPLKERLKRVTGLKIKTAKRGVRVAQNLFGGEVEQDIEEMSGRKVIGIYESIEILDTQGDKHKVDAKVDTGAYFTSIDVDLVEQLGLVEKITRYKKARSALGEEKRPLIGISFILDEALVQTEASLSDRSKLKNKVLIGRRDLKKFLVDPSKIIPKNK